MGPPDFGVVGARVCDNDGEIRQSDTVPGVCTAYGPLSSRKKQDMGLFKSSYAISSTATEDTSQGLDHGVTNGSITSMFGSEGKQVERRVGKVSRNGSGSFRKLRMLQEDTVLPPAENEASKMELDTLGSQFVKCSNAADKCQTVKQRTNINGKRGDKRNNKAKIDIYSMKAGLPNFSPATGSSNAFGKYGLKPDVNDVAKLMEDISLDKLLDGTYKYPTFGKDKETRTTNVNANVLDSVRKVYSLICLQGAQHGKQTEEVDIHAIEKPPSSSSPSRDSVENDSDTEGVAGLSECGKDSEPCNNAEASTDLNNSPLYKPRDVLERLALPPPKDLESLLRDPVKPAAPMKFIDSWSTKQPSHRVSLPPFPWSHNFHGHHKSSNDALKNSNKSTWFGRWVRISSTASFIGRSTEGSVDLDSLTYDNSVVPTGQLKYRLPEVGDTSTTSIRQHFAQQDVSPVACPPVSLPPRALHSPKIVAAARTLCDMASCSKHSSGGILKWPKRPSQKAMKARRSRLDAIPEEEFSASKSEFCLGHVGRNADYGPSSKKPKISQFERREEHSHVQAVGLCSVSAPRSSRSSPSRVSRDSMLEGKHSNGSFVKSFMFPPPPRVLDRNCQNPQKSRKIMPIDRNRTRN